MVVRWVGQSLMELCGAAFFCTGAWNLLPGLVVEADAIVIFKRLLERYMIMCRKGRRERRVFNELDTSTSTGEIQTERP